MKKLLFVVCMICVFGSSIAQSNPPVNNVIRWIRLDGDYSSNPFSSFNDFLGGCDLSLLPLGEVPGTGGTTSWFSLDLSTTPIENLTVSIGYSFVRPDHLEGTGNLFAGANHYDADGVWHEPIIPTQYSESVSNDNGKTGVGFVSMTNDCIPTSNEYFIEVLIVADIEWENGNYSGLIVMYDFSLDGNFQ